MPPYRSSIRILLLLVLLLSAACGKKTSPVPPQTVLPEPINDLSYLADETGVTLSWSWPERTELGDTVRSLSHFLLEKADYKKDAFCPTCPIKFDTKIKIDGGEKPADKNTARVYFRDQNLEPEHQYLYRVSSSLGWGMTSVPSEPVSFIWHAPLPAPEKISAHSGDNRVDISWQPMERDKAGKLVAGEIRYRIYRGSGDEELVPVSEPLAQNTYSDIRVTNGKSYRYQVMAIRSSGGGGALSDIVEATPNDLTPPPAPRGLKAVRTTGGVSLFWDPVISADLAGYKIFRRNTYIAPKPGEQQQEQDLAYREIGSVPAPATNFTDHDLPKTAKAWHYAVGSFDKNKNPNISPLSREIKIKREP